MEQSILTSTKKVLNIAPDDPSFDDDIITHINTAFSNLNDMGVGPISGFVIESADEEWASYFPNEDDPMKLKVQLSKVKTVVFLRVRLLFDPPTVAFVLDAAKEQLREAEWRLNVNREDVEWTDPVPAEVLVVDGGDPED
jgi:hypothetical protein